MLFLSFGCGEEKVNSEGKTRAKVVSIEPGRARTRVASYHGKTLDQGRTNRGDSGGQRGAHPSFGNRKDRRNPQWTLGCSVRSSEWTGTKRGSRHPTGAPAKLGRDRAQRRRDSGPF